MKAFLSILLCLLALTARPATSVTPGGNVTPAGLTNRVSGMIGESNAVLISTVLASNATFQSALAYIEGDSLSTTNYCGPGNGWFEFLQTNVPWSSPRWVWTNTAAPFQTASNSYLNFSTRAGSVGVLSNTTPQWGVFFIWSGLNDLVNGYGTNATIGFLSNNWRVARESGYSVVAFTLPISAHDYYVSNTPPEGPVEFTTNRWTVNNWIRDQRATRAFDFLIDLDTLLTNANFVFDDEFGPVNAWGPLPGYTVDGVHLSSTGNLVVASCIATQILRHTVQPFGVLGGTVRGKIKVTDHATLQNGLTIEGHNAGVGKVWSDTNAAGRGQWADRVALNSIQFAAGETTFWITTGGAAGNSLIISNISQGTVAEYDGTAWRTKTDLFADSLVITNEIGRTFSLLSGVGGANTNFTLNIGEPLRVVNGFTNVSLRAVMGTSASLIHDWSLLITNGSGTSRTLEFSAVTNRWRFHGTYGTNAPNTLTNGTQLLISGRSIGTNTLVSYNYFAWP